MLQSLTQCRRDPGSKCKLARALQQQIQPLAIPAGKRPEARYRGLDYAVYQTGYWLVVVAEVEGVPDARSSPVLTAGRFAGHGRAGGLSARPPGTTLLV